MYDFAQRFSQLQNLPSGTPTKSEKVFDFGAGKNYEQGSMEKVNMHMSVDTTLSLKVFTGGAVSNGRIVSPKLAMTLEFVKGDVLGFVLPANRNQFVELEYTAGAACKISAYLTDSIRNAL